LRWKKVAPRFVVAFLLSSGWFLSAEPSVRSWNREAVERLQAFEFAAAVDGFKTALQSNPESLVIRVNLSLAYLYTGEFEQARQQLRYVLAENPSEPYAEFLCGVIADREGRTETARSHFQTVLKLSPGDPGTYYHLGLIALRENRAIEAVELFEKSFSGNPDCASSLYNLGRALLASGQSEKGEAALQEFQALQLRKKPEKGGGMGDPSVLVGRYGQPRTLPDE